MIVSSMAVIIMIMKILRKCIFMEEQMMCIDDHPNLLNDQSAWREQTIPLDEHHRIHPENRHPHNYLLQESLRLG